LVLPCGETASSPQFKEQPLATLPAALAEPIMLCSDRQSRRPPTNHGVTLIWSIILAENEKSEQTYPIFCCRGVAESALSKFAPPHPFAAPPAG
jgi:hypothetical protein